MLSKLARLSAGVLIVLTIIVYSQAIFQDRLLVHVLNFDKLNQDKYQRFLMDYHITNILRRLLLHCIILKSIIINLIATK